MFRTNCKSTGFLFVILAFSMLVSGCVQNAYRKKADPDRQYICKRWEANLRSDWDVKVGGGYGFISGSIRVSRDVANQISEERLVAMRMMIATCQLWALREISSEQFDDRIESHARVLTASTDLDEVSNRVRKLEETIRKTEGLIIELSDNDKSRITNEAKALSAGNLSEIADRLQESTNKTRAETMQNLDGTVTGYATSLFDEARFTQFENRIKSLEREIAVLRGETTDDGPKVGYPDYPEGFELARDPLGVPFEPEKSHITKEARRILDTLAAEVAEVENAVVWVAGYDLGAGSPSSLARRRALAVSNYLKSLDIKVSRLYNFGKQVPEADRKVVKLTTGATINVLAG